MKSAPGNAASPPEPPFAATLEVRDRCLCLHLQRAARAIARRFDEVLRPHGLTSGQFSLLMALNRPEPPRMKDVATTLAMDRTTLTANLKPLARRGLLAIETDPSDRRTRRLRLTDAGGAALKAALPVWRSTHDAIDRDLAPGDPDALRGMLRAFA